MNPRLVAWVEWALFIAIVVLVWAVLPYSAGP